MVRTRFLFYCIVNRRLQNNLEEHDLNSSSSGNQGQEKSCFPKQGSTHYKFGAQS